jgi:catechol 2,3-dioxygenase-like lactoylglutathione lyase family enzyme
MMLNSSLEGVTLQVADVEKSLAFYRAIPGAVVTYHRPDQFAILTIGKGRLGLLAKQLGGPTHVEIETADLDALYQQLRDAGITPEGPPSKKPWESVRDFVVVDPDGHVIEFGEPHDTEEAS